MPDVSFIIPVYNRTQGLRISLNSIIKSNLKFSFEIIVVDDGSTKPVYDQIGKVDARIKVIRQTNRGAAVARHVGICHASAESVFFLDAGDTINSRGINILYNRFQQINECVAAIGIGVNQMNPFSLPSWASRLNGPSNIIKEPLSFYLSSPLPLSSSMGFLAKREPALRASANRDFYRAANDYDIQIRLAEQGPFMLLPIITHYFKLSVDGISKKYGIKQQIGYAIYSSWDLYRKLSPEIQQKYKKKYKNMLTLWTPVFLFSSMCYKNLNLYCKIFKITFCQIGLMNFLKGCYWYYSRKNQLKA